MSNIHDFISANLEFAAEEVDVVAESIGGATNRTAVFVYRNRKYVLRFGTHHAEQLRINRHAEYEALKAMSDTIGEISYFNAQNGDMVMEFIKGTVISSEDLQKPEWIDRAALLLKKLHSKKIAYEFEPFTDIDVRFEQCRKKGIKLDERLPGIMKQCKVVQERLEKDRPLYYGLCHNDLFAGNFIWKDDQKLCLIDYEYAGNGDTFFDLACLAWGYTPEMRCYLLKSYTGSCNPDLYRRLKDSLFTVILWNASWAAVKSDQTHASFEYWKGYTDLMNMLASWDDTVI